MVFLYFPWEFNSKLAGPCKTFSNASIVYVNYFSHLEAHFIQNIVVDIRKTATTKTGETYSLLAHRTFN